MILGISFSDEKIHILDMRAKNSQQIVIPDAHSEMIRNIKLAPDGMVCFSSGSDCTLKIWDLSMRRCIKTYGSENEYISRKFSNYHKDSITSLYVSFAKDLAFTGGREGSIFINEIVDNQEYMNIYQGDMSKK